MDYFKLTLAAAAMAAATLSLATSALGAPGPLCSTLKEAVDRQPGGGPAFVESYRIGPGERALPDPLQNSAFVYDNALTAVALIGCGHVDEARRIGDALVYVQSHDRYYRDGRIRNAYRSGEIIPEGAVAPFVALPGWWDTTSNRWQEDAYQVGTSVGNVAWAALALLHLHEATAEAAYLAAAQKLMEWIRRHASDDAEPAGFTGGFDGFEPAAARITWKSTEHNVDVMAAATWLAELSGGAGPWSEMAATARSFLDAMHVSGRGFQIGTTPDNQPAGFVNLVLDAQLWPPIALAAPPKEWNDALDVARRSLAVPGGFDFNGDRDGLWTEGTAQAALTFFLTGERAEAADLLKTVLAQRDPASGWLMATEDGTVSTGLSVGATGGQDFLYFHRPHLGATAWAALAAQEINPFLPRSTRQ